MTLTTFSKHAMFDGGGKAHQMNAGAVMTLFENENSRGFEPVTITEDQLAFFEQADTSEDDRRAWLEWFGLAEVSSQNVTVVEDIIVQPDEGSYKSWKDVPQPLVQEIFEVWQQVHSKKRAVLSQDRLKAISKAVVDFGRETVLHAIHGASLSPWHMGKNPSGKKYNDISLILRNAEKIEGFAEVWLDRRSAGGFLDER